MKTIYTILLSLISGLGVTAQAPNIFAVDACGDTYTGVSYVYFTHNTSTYPLPYTGNYYNITSGDYEEFIIITNPHKFKDLYPGEYEFQINLGSDVVVEYCEEILNDESKIAAFQKSTKFFKSRAKASDKLKSVLNVGFKSPLSILDIWEMDTSALFAKCSCDKLAFNLSFLRCFPKDLQSSSFLTFIMMQRNLALYLFI